MTFGNAEGAASVNDRNDIIVAATSDRMETTIAANAQPPFDALAVLFSSQIQHDAIKLINTKNQVVLRSYRCSLQTREHI